MSESESVLSRFISGTVSVGLGNVSAMVLRLLGVMIAARYIPAEAFGAFVLVRVVASFLTEVSSFGLDLSVARFITSREEEQDRRKLINTAITFRLLIILPVSLIALVARPVLCDLFGSSLVPDIVLFVPLLFLLESLSDLLRSVLQGLLLFRRIGVVAFAASLLDFVLILVFLLIMDMGVMGLIYARVTALSLSCAVVYFSLPIKKELGLKLDVLKEMLSFGFPLQINDVLSFVFRRIDTLVIGALLGPAEIAYYEIARKIPDNLGQLYEAFRSVFFALLSRLFGLGKSEKAAQVINNTTRLISFVGILGALFALVFGHDIITLLFSEQYVASVPVFILLMIKLSLGIINNVLGTSLVAVGDSEKPAIINVVHTAVSVPGNLILIPILGILGAALAGLAGNVATNPLNVLFLRRRQVDVKVREYIKPLLVFGACLLLFLLFKPTTLLQKSLFLPLFLVPCLLLSVITKNDLDSVLGEIKLMLLKPIQNVRSGGTGS